MERQLRRRGLDRPWTRPLRYPWEWLEPVTRCACAWCGYPSPPVAPSRRRNVTCVRCGGVFNSFSGRLIHPGRDVPPWHPDDSGDREPLVPHPVAGAGAVALPLPDDDVGEEDDGLSTAS